MAVDKALHFVLKNNDYFTVDAADVILHFSGRRNVVGTSCLHGGFQSDLETVFIHCDKDPATGMCEMEGATYEEHLAKAAKKAALAPDNSTGLSTAAPVRYVAFEQESFRQYTVTAAVTGGILHNGRRIGDTATMWEQDGICHVLPDDAPSIHDSGTINIIVHIDANLSPQAMVTAIMLATEAKAAAIEELGLKSCYSQGLATGSGTDGIVIVADGESEIYLTQAGSDLKLGQCIGRAVKRALRRELEMQLAMDQ